MAATATPRSTWETTAAAAASRACPCRSWASSETHAEAGVRKPGSYTSGGNTGLDTVTNISGTIDPSWKDCSYLHDLARNVRAAADIVGSSSTPNGSLGSAGAAKMVYIEGDYI